MLPALAGYESTAPEKVPAPSGLDIVFSLYRKAGTQAVAARVEARVYASEGDAKADYPTQAQGWKNPPPGLFGVAVQNGTATPLAGLVEATAYASQGKDAQGNRLYTDVYRIGRVVVVQLVLAPADVEAATLRKALSDSVKAKVGQ